MPTADEEGARRFKVALGNACKDGFSCGAQAAHGNEAKNPFRAETPLHEVWQTSYDVGMSVAGRQKQALEIARSLSAPAGGPARLGPGANILIEELSEQVHLLVKKVDGLKDDIDMEWAATPGTAQV